MPSKLPRCKNGYNRKPAKTGICVKKGVEKIDAIKKEKKTGLVNYTLLEMSILTRVVLGFCQKP